MTNEEFSNEFDVLYNSITSNQAPGLDEYEKSVFLTKAQSEILREYFNSRVDGTNGGFDGSQKRQYDFSFLIKTAVLEANSKTEGDIHKVDVLLFGNGTKIKVNMEDKDLYAAIDKATDILERQVRKHKEKLKDHNKKGSH